MGAASGAARQGHAEGPLGQGLLGQPGPAGSTNGPRGPLADTAERDRAGGLIIRQKDSAIPDPSSPSGAIAAIEADNLTSFARDLRAMRAKAELDYPEMAERSHYTMRTLASAAGGLRLPTLPVLVAYVQACGGNVEEWEERWGRIAKTLKKEERAALPAAGSAELADGQEEPAPAPRQMPAPPQDDGAVYVITSAKSREEHW